jgi:TonB family protein
MRRNRATWMLAAVAFLFVAFTTTQAQTNPTPKSGDLDRGIELYHQGNYSAASDLLKKVANETKTDDTAWYYLGLSLLRQKDLKEATEALERSVQLQPKSASSHVALGYALIMQNKVAVALHEALEAQAIDPQIVDAHYISGVAYLRLGKRQLALKEAETILKLNPKFANAYLLKSQALAGTFADETDSDATNDSIQPRYAQAGDALEKYLQLNQDPEDKSALTEQLESLRFFQAQGKSLHKVAYTGREVTTKARVLSKPAPECTQRARYDGISGTVVLRVIFGADGTVRHIIILRGLPDGLTEAAIAAARGIRFTPATRDGVPVSMYVQLEYNFN